MYYSGVKIVKIVASQNWPWNDISWYSLGQWL